MIQALSLSTVGVVRRLHGVGGALRCRAEGVARGNEAEGRRARCL